MGMYTQHYVGYYFRCEKTECNPYDIFPDEEFCRVYDENGNDEINANFIFICNTSAVGGHHLLDERSNGIIDLPTRMFPKEFQNAKRKLESVYLKVEVCFGVISYTN